MKQLTRARRLAHRLTYANVVATLAFVIAVSGGTAYAASHLITGKQIAKHTISATNIKTKTLTSALFKKGALKAGPRGATGATGATGPAGAAGAAGPAGSAVAHASVVVNSTGNPALGSPVGFTSVSNPQPDVYCIGPVVSGHPTIVASVIGSTSVSIGEFSPQQCAGDYELGTSAALGNGQGFNVVVP